MFVTTQAELTPINSFYYVALPYIALPDLDSLQHPLFSHLADNVLNSKRKAAQPPRSLPEHLKKVIFTSPAE